MQENNFFVLNDDDRLPEGYEKVSIKVGVAPAREVTFAGALLGEWGAAREGDVRTLRVYRTPEGRFVLHTRREDRVKLHGSDRSIWGWRSFLDMSLGRGEQSWSVIKGGASVTEVETIEGLSELVPEHVLREIRDVLGDPDEARP
ncbi:EXLDI protein [Micromonospora sp. CA-248089]|uniref:EXLDI protein n=1 Tax=Micromonospora sp. CA-248089 TaxID=3239960 RepID=UPI003D92147C